MNLLSFIKNTPFLNYLYKRSILPRAQIKFRRIESLISKEESILDIGCGNGGVLLLLTKEGYRAKGIDVQDHNFYSGNITELYNGKKLPYSDKQSDFGLLLTVLHHAQNPISLLSEAGRVCRKLIIIEDIYTSNWNKRLLFFIDSLVNFEWFKHPHNNKTEREWEDIFSELDFTIISKQEHRLMYVFKQVTYYLNT